MKKKRAKVDRKLRDSVGVSEKEMEILCEKERER